MIAAANIINFRLLGRATSFTSRLEFRIIRYSTWWFIYCQ